MEGLGGGFGGLIELPEDLGFDSQFEIVGKFVAVGTEELDAIVFPGIVGGGDNDAGGEAVGASEKGDGRGGDHAGGFDQGAPGEEAGGERGRDRLTRFARIHPEQNFGAGRGETEGSRERQADGVHRGRIERRNAGDATDAVSAEEFFHKGSDSRTSALRVPWARWARILCPGLASPADWRRVDSAPVSR